MKKRRRKKSPRFYAKQPVKHVVGFSGGIDSQACARWVLNRFPNEDVILLNSDVGGHEHPITTQFIEDYSNNIHSVVIVTPLVVDIGRISDGKLDRLSLKLTDRLTFEKLALVKGIWPTSQIQFCTTHLKLFPQVRWMKENLRAKGFSWVRYSGKRRQESVKRRSSQATAWDDVFGCELFQPIMDWTKQMCFDYVKYHGENINPLYTYGFSRIGCAPCINANKKDIRNWALRFPEMIDKVRGWEESVGIPFFRPKGTSKERLSIDEVVEWAMTKHGGKEFDLEVLEEPPSCDSQYGICE